MKSIQVGVSMYESKEESDGRSCFVFNLRALDIIDDLKEGRICGYIYVLM